MTTIGGGVRLSAVTIGNIGLWTWNGSVGLAKGALIMISSIKLPSIKLNLSMPVGQSSSSNKLYVKTDSKEILEFVKLSMGSSWTITQINSDADIKFSSAAPILICYKTQAQTCDATVALSQSASKNPNSKIIAIVDDQLGVETIRFLKAKGADIGIINVHQLQEEIFSLQRQHLMMS